MSTEKFDKYDVLFVRLNGKNYSTWAFQFQIFVKGKELWGYVDRTDSAPDKTTHQTTHAKWETKDAQVMAWLVGSDTMSNSEKIWEFGCQEDMIFCGIFDGHGPWGHYVPRRVRESMPPSLLCNWQETLSQTSLDPEIDIETEKKQQWFNILKHSYLKTCATIDQELEQNRKIDTFFSGTTALSIVR